MAFSDRILDKLVKILPILGTFLFGYNAYLQILQNKDPLLSAFSLAVFITFLVSIAAVTYGHSLRQEGSEKERKRAAVAVACLFAFVGASFLIRAWTVLPAESSWVVPASCALPVLALLAFLFFHQKLSNPADPERLAVGHIPKT